MLVEIVLNYKGKKILNSSSHQFRRDHISLKSKSIFTKFYKQDGCTVTNMVTGTNFTSQFNGTLPLIPKLKWIYDFGVRKNMFLN